MMTWAEYIPSLWGFYGSSWQLSLPGRTMCKPFALPFHELSHCGTDIFFLLQSSLDKRQGLWQLTFSFFLSRRVHRKAGCCWTAAPRRTRLAKLLFLVRLLHRSEPTLFSFSFPAQNNVYDLRNISSQNGNGNVNYGYEHEVCFSLLASRLLFFCRVCFISI